MWLSINCVKYEYDEWLELYGLLTYWPLPQTDGSKANLGLRLSGADGAH